MAGDSTKARWRIVRAVDLEHAYRLASAGAPIAARRVSLDYFLARPRNRSPRATIPQG